MPSGLIEFTKLRGVFLQSVLERGDRTTRSLLEKHFPSGTRETQKQAAAEDLTEKRAGLLGSNGKL